jgi:4-aminobutyrate aminotransferase-like enzyme
MQKEHLCEQALEKGTYLLGPLNRKQSELALVGEIRGKGLMIGMELVLDEKRTPALAEAEAVRELCLANGVLVGVGGVYGNVVRIQPPLVMSQQQIDQAVDVVAGAMERVQAASAVSAGR